MHHIENRVGKEKTTLALAAAWLDHTWQELCYAVMISQSDAVYGVPTGYSLLKRVGNLSKKTGI